jgi:hypothetical protein
MEKAMKKEEIAHCMHWYLLLESSNTDNAEEVRAFYTEILEELKDNLNETCPEIFNSLQSAIALRARLLALSTHIKGLTKVKIDQKTAILQKLLVDTGNPEFNLLDLGAQGMTLAHEPSIKVYSVRAR